MLVLMSLKVIHGTRLFSVVRAFVPFAERPLNGTSEWEDIKNIFIDLETTRTFSSDIFSRLKRSLSDVLCIVITIEVHI